MLDSEKRRVLRKTQRRLNRTLNDLEHAAEAEEFRAADGGGADAAAMPLTSIRNALFAAEDIIEKTLAAERAERVVRRSGPDAVESALVKYRADHAEAETGDIADRHRCALVDVDRRLGRLETRTRTIDGNHEKLVAEHVAQKTRLDRMEKRLDRMVGGPPPDDAADGPGEQPPAESPQGGTEAR